MFLASLRILIIAILSAVMAILAMVATLLNRSGQAFHAVARLHARLVLVVAGVKIETSGLDRIDFTHHYVYVANHASFFDIPAVIAGIPDQIRIVYRRSLEKIPIFGWGLKVGHYISIEREGGRASAQSLDEAAKKIRHGASVLLFAEGTRSVDGRLQAFKRGPFHLAVQAGVPIVPVTINGSHEVLPRNSLRIRPGTISLTLSSPIEPPGTNGKETELDVRDRVHEIIRQNLKQ
jgi:1-acyl-sn-glycerol-3-phosphate acyltransferase